MMKRPLLDYLSILIGTLAVLIGGMLFILGMIEGNGKYITLGILNLALGLTNFTFI